MPAAPTYAALGDLLRRLDADGELHRVAAPVDPSPEITEIILRQNGAACPTPSRFADAFDGDRAARGGRALLFENVRGCDFPLAINVFGSYRRMELALGCAESGGFEAIAGRIASLVKPEPPRSLGEAIAKAREFAPLLKIGPKRVKRGPAQEVVKRAERGEVDLTRLPIMQCWPLDGDPAAVGYPLTAAESGTADGGGRYITLAGMHTIHADDVGVAKPASHNIGMYRSQLIDATHLAMHWHMHHDGAAHWRSWKKRGEPMPIVIALGGESVLPYAATAPLPPGISELLMAGFLNGRGIPMVKAKTVDLWAPANAEILIEGYVSTECGPIGWDPRDTDEPLGPGAVFEGPFGDHTGFYSLPDRYPIVTVTAITHRRDAVYPSTVVGLPPQEDYYLGKATERLFFPLLKTLIHDIEDYHLPEYGCFHNAAFIRIRKAYPLQARRVMHSVWGAGQMAWTKTIIVVDEDVDVHDEAAVWQAVCERCDFARDVETVNGPLDILDHAAPRLGAGTKIGFDATRAWPGEEVGGMAVEPHEDFRPLAEADLSGLHTTSPLWSKGRIVFVHPDHDGPRAGFDAINAVWDASASVEHAADLVFAVDPSVDLGAWERVFFFWCANADPGRDAIRRGRRLGFDATTKSRDDDTRDERVRAFPPLVDTGDDVRARVDERWSEYGFASG